jgi:hypothetical protein
VDSTPTTTAGWIALDGAANARDLGGLPAGDGRRIAPRRLIRSDSLEGLSPRDVTLLVEELGVHRVIDLREADERAATGPSPLDDDPRVEVLRLRLLGAPASEAARISPQAPEPAPRLVSCGTGHCPDGCLARPYRGFLRRHDSILAAFEAIATTSSATLVHCAAGKDRTGVLVALVLDLLDVPRPVIVADYARSAERVDAVMARFRAAGIHDEQRPRSEYAPQAATIRCFLDELQRSHGGAAGWLAEHGWGAADTARLRARLTQP